MKSTNDKGQTLISLPVHNILITLDGTGGGTIVSDLHENDQVENPMQECEVAKYNAAIDGLESLILAHACSGIDVESPEYLEGIETAESAIGHHYGD